MMCFWEFNKNYIQNTIFPIIFQISIWFSYASSWSKKAGFSRMLCDLYRSDEIFFKLSSLVEFLQLTLDLDLEGMLTTSVSCIAIANLSAWKQQPIIYIMDRKMLALTYIHAKCAIRNSCECQRRDGHPA